MPRSELAPAAAASLRDEGGRALAAAGIPEPRREAAAILAALAGWRVADRWSWHAAPVNAALERRFRTAIQRRAAGEPSAYLTGQIGFRHLELAIDPSVLIPRPETEGLVDHVLQWARKRGGAWGRALEIGTGSGCLALSLALEGGFESLVATDVSPGALAVARRNAARVPARTAVEFRLGDLFGPVAGERFDVIVSNPPYVSEAEFAALDWSVRGFEPPLALVGGPSGLELTERLVSAVPEFLAPAGLLALEIAAPRAAATLELVERHGWCACVRPDAFGRLRYLLATREPGAWT
jgi:release factor glutamine methyltransferase